MIWKRLDWINPRYEISEIGVVRSTSRIGRIGYVSSHLNKYGYAGIILSIKGHPKNFLVHRLVAQAFIPNPEAKAQVNHMNHKRDDNRVENLEWVTYEENMAHCGNPFSPGEDHCGCKISDADVAEVIRLDKERKMTRTQIAHKFGISESHVAVLRRGVRDYSALDKKEKVPRTKPLRLFYSYPNEMIVSISELLKSGLTRKEVSLKTGAPYALVYRVHIGKRKPS